MMNESRALVIGGAGGLGFSIAAALARRGVSVDIYDRATPEFLPENCFFTRFNLLSDDISALPENPSALIYAAGVGRVAEFGSLTDYEIKNGYRVNAEAPARVLRKYIHKLYESDFRAAFICSVAGHLPSPLFAAYGSQKSALRSLIESVNAELAHNSAPGSILLVSPGKIEGTGFYGRRAEPEKTAALAERIIDKMYAREKLFIPDIETYAPVIARANENPEEFARQSIEYKRARVSDKPVGVRGFLSGTFDLFHIGHLNLIKRAARMCDYLTVGVHPEGSSHKSKPVFIPLAERMEIIRNIGCVDRVIETLDEDDDMYFIEPFDMLFVGSDYKGTPRFERYERALTPLGVQIIYFPYTTGTSSTQLRDIITRNSAGGQNG